MRSRPALPEAAAVSCASNLFRVLSRISKHHQQDNPQSLVCPRVAANVRSSARQVSPHAHAQLERNVSLPGAHRSQGTGGYTRSVHQQTHAHRPCGAGPRRAHALVSHPKATPLSQATSSPPRPCLDPPPWQHPGSTQVCGPHSTGPTGLTPGGPKPWAQSLPLS